MKKRPHPKAPRVAISLEMEWGFKRHLEIYAGCQRFADEAGWNCFIHPAPEWEIKGTPSKAPFDGIIARVTPEMAALAQQATIPIVNVWMNSPVQHVPSVFADLAASGVMAAEHLVARGFRQFGYLGFLNAIDSRVQLDGFRNVVQREGHSCSVHRFSRTSMEGKARGWQKWVAGIGSWVDSWKPPIGVLVSHDLYCRYLIDVLRAKGLHVSQDVAVVGTSNEELICETPPPSLTSIDINFAQIGYRAAAMLDSMMRGQKVPAEPEYVPPAELVPRQSTDAYAANDPIVARALRFIAEHGHERIEVKEVVAAVGTNRRNLERKFRESVGRSIAAEITRMRLERAKRRMVETDAPMKDVALDAGFRNADHFYKVFTRVEGIPPTRYRDERQQAFPKKT